MYPIMRLIISSPCYC